MFELRCTVRNCHETLRQRDKALFCAAGHHFDRAKEGYWSLLQPQDRRSRHPGDPDAAVLARHHWLARGHVSGLTEMLLPWVQRSSRDSAVPPSQTVSRTFDLGCGEGSFGPMLFPAESAGYCGIDLSKRALKIAARGWPEATWVLANADRTLPAADATVDRVVSLFGRRPISEIRRVLRPDGVCIVAVPGEEDLIELRERVQHAGHRRSRSDLVLEQMSAAGFECVEHQQWRHQVELEPDAIAEALTMTYRAGRKSEQSRLAGVPSMQVTLSADLLYLCNRV